MKAQFAFLFTFVALVSSSVFATGLCEKRATEAAIHYFKSAENTEVPEACKSGQVVTSAKFKDADGVYLVNPPTKKRVIVVSISSLQPACGASGEMDIGFAITKGFSNEDFSNKDCPELDTSL